MLEIKNLNVVFNANTVNEHHALKNISLSINDHDFITVIGSNGAGKTTLLNAICGQIQDMQGELLLNYDDLRKYPEHQRALRIGRLFQDPKLGTAPSLSVEENLALALSRGQKRLFGFAVRNKERTLFVEKLKSLNLGLEHRLHQSAGQLSGGQRQALALIMATIIPPQLLLLDEHTAALDPKTAHHIMEMTSDLINEHHIPTLMITHNIEHALKYGNRTLVLSKGKIIADLNETDRKNMTVEDIMQLYRNENEMLEDRMILG